MGGRARPGAAWLSWSSAVSLPLVLSWKQERDEGSRRSQAESYPFSAEFCWSLSGFLGSQTTAVWP